MKIGIKYTDEMIEGIRKRIKTQTRKPVFKAYDYAILPPPAMPGDVKPVLNYSGEETGLYHKITSVRIEKLQDISRWDIDSEGCPLRVESDQGIPIDQLNWFIDLWDSIYGSGSWVDNPAVWVIQFELTEG